MFFDQSIYIFFLSDNTSNSLGSLQLESGKARKIRPALASDLADLHHRVVVIRDDRDLFLCFDRLDDFLNIVMILWNLSCILNERGLDIRILLHDLFDHFWIVEIRHDRNKP